MRVVVASGNIFRREFSSYVLAEAGYEISEARTIEELSAALRNCTPGIVVLDQQLTSGEPITTLRTVRALSAALLIWIGDPQRLRPLIMVDQRPAQSIQWPFRGDELVSAVTTLLGRAAADLTATPPRERFAGSAE